MERVLHTTAFSRAERALAFRALACNVVRYSHHSTVDKYRCHACQLHIEVRKVVNNNKECYQFWFIGQQKCDHALLGPKTKEGASNGIHGYWAKDVEDYLSKGQVPSWISAELLKKHFDLEKSSFLEIPKPPTLKMIQDRARNRRFI